jgi:DNA end-binding protein Ku
MAPRPFWKGYLKLSLVNCPVALTPAITEDKKLRFHILNRDTGNRVVSRFVDEGTGEPVEDENQAAGYERSAEDYVLLEEEELEAVSLESTRTIDIETFTPASSVGWVWLDRPYYLTPDDPVGEEAFCVIRDAMKAARVVGISRLVLFRRERAVMLEPRDNGLVLWTLRYGDEVRSADEYFTDIEDGECDPRLLDLVSTLIRERSEAWSPTMAADPIRDRLLHVIESKKKHRPPPRVKAQETEAQPKNVINIMEALRKSISREKGQGDRR